MAVTFASRLDLCRSFWICSGLDTNLSSYKLKTGLSTDPVCLQNNFAAARLTSSTHGAVVLLTYCLSSQSTIFLAPPPSVFGPPPKRALTWCTGQETTAKSKEGKLKLLFIAFAIGAGCSRISDVEVHGRRPVPIIETEGFVLVLKYCISHIAFCLSRVHVLRVFVGHSLFGAQLVLREDEHLLTYFGASLRERLISLLCGEFVMRDETEVQRCSASFNGFGDGAFLDHPPAERAGAVRHEPVRVIPVGHDTGVMRCIAQPLRGSTTTKRASDSTNTNTP